MIRELMVSCTGNELKHGLGLSRYASNKGIGVLEDVDSPTGDHLGIQEQYVEGLFCRG